MRRSASLLFALCVGVVVGQDVGSVVPEMRWKTRFNWGDLQAEKLSDLRGSAVLLEFFTTGENLCIEQVPRLCALHQNDFKNGLVVIGVTGDADFAVKAFIADHAATYPIGIGGGEGFEVEIVPHSILVDPDGHVVWNGPSAEFEPSMLRAAMEHARPASYAAGLEDVAKHMATERLGDAWTLCQQLLQQGALGDDAKAQAQKLSAVLEVDAAAALARGSSALDGGELFDAVSAYEAANERFAGMPGVAEAMAKVQELRADKKSRREIEAGGAFAAAFERESGRYYDDAYEAYQDVRRHFQGTRAGKKADERARQIKKDGKLGFMKACGACEALDRACDLHKGRKRR